MSWYQASKLWVLESAHVSRNAAHVLAGLAILATVLVVHRSARTWRCIIPTALGALVGEGLDLWDALNHGSPVRLADAVEDVVLTVIPASVVLGLLIYGARLSRLTAQP